MNSSTNIYENWQSIKEVIAKREKENDGTIIHLYYDEATDVYMAFGYSAYALRLYAKGNSMDSLRGYSTVAGMPITIVPIDVPQILRKRLCVLEDNGNEYIQFKLEKTFEHKDYVEWMSRLSAHKSTKKDEIEVKTLVSEYVPKDVYIPDNMSWFTRNTKRIIDWFISSICLIVFSPLMLLVHIAIKLDDGGPSIYRQERIGRFGRTFHILKFRSMRLDSEKFGPQLSHAGGDDDPRLTKVGKFIRAHHLDELPQLYNVWIGDMAFIGYRPERQFFIDQIMEYDYRYSYLYQIRPGVTSYATLYNGYTDTMEKMLKRLEYDLYYLQHRSLWFDMKILWNTFASIVFGKKF